MTSPIETQTWRTHRARLGSLTRQLGPDHPEVLAERRAFRLAYAESILERTLRTAPPLTPEQRDRIASLLSGVPQVRD